MTRTDGVTGVDRRTFLFANLALATGAWAQGAPPVTLTQWLALPRARRDAALQSQVERIRSLDDEIHAWVQVLPQPPTADGPLGGIPFGVKDIIETRGLATEYGSPIYKGRIGAADAAIVRSLRDRGGVLVGKTHTTAFAYRTPAPTRNPRNPAHTPGGSSSGSAAAVAAGMVPIALGTQTGGSVIRPASFCGVTGFKTSYGLLDMDGVLPFARSLDTLGFFTHTAADMLAFWEAIGQPTGGAEDVPLGAPDPMPEVEPAMAAAFKDAVARLRRSGVEIRSVDIAAMLVRLGAAQQTVMFYEGARFHQERYEQYGDRLADMATLVREGLRISAGQYDEARTVIAECKTRMAELYEATPVVLVPAATGPAPQGLSSTGDSRLNRPWTALGTPAIAVPMPVGSALPLGLQLTADHRQDARLLQSALRVERILGESMRPAAGVGHPGIDGRAGADRSGPTWSRRG
jgi:Asp-tRNA(Asn)/Glu-tRNA(Gln) amidotransferase A subunit family amidase